MNLNILQLNKKIINCNKCSRLVKFRNKISLEKRKKILMRRTGVNQWLALVTRVVKS